MDWINPQIIYLILHLFGVALGAGAAYTGDFLFMTSIKDRRIGPREAKLLEAAGKVVWIGLAILLVSGIGLVSQRPEIFLNSGKFWAKMTVVAVIALNGLLFHFVYRPIFNKSGDEIFSPTHAVIKNRVKILASGAISVVSWSYAIILGTLNRTPFTYWQFIGVYLILSIVAVFGALLLKDKIIPASK